MLVEGSFSSSRSFSSGKKCKRSVGYMRDGLACACACVCGDICVCLDVELCSSMCMCVCVCGHFYARGCLFCPCVLMSVRQEIMRASLRERESVPRSCSA